MKVKSLSRDRFLVTPSTAAYHAPPSMGVSRQEYWSGVPLMPDAGNSLAVQQLGLGAFTTVSLGSIPGEGTKIPAVVLKPVQFQAWGQPNKNSALRATDLRS